MANPTTLLETLSQYDEQRQEHLATEIKNLEDQLIIVFDVNTANYQVTLRYFTGLTTISWGDGTVDTVNDTNGTLEYTHTYEKTGIYTAVFNDVTRVYWAAYPNALRIKNVYVGNKVVNCNGGFSGASILTNATIKNLSSLGGEFFRSCPITKIDIPNSVTSIDLLAFYGSQLKSIIIPDSVTSIGIQTFSNISTLNSVEIGYGITEIKQYAFSDCTNLKSITIKAITPPTLGTNVFDNTNNCPIYVPLQSLNAYKTATNWSAYASRIVALVDTNYSPKIKTISIDTPVWTNQPTISGTLDNSFVNYVKEYYFVTLKDTDGTALSLGQFKLTLTEDGYATAISQVFTLSGYDTGNSGILTENTIVDFKTISNDRTTFEMRNDTVGYYYGDVISLKEDNSAISSGEIDIYEYAYLPYTQTLSDYTAGFMIIKQTHLIDIYNYMRNDNALYLRADIGSGKFSSTNRYCALINTAHLTIENKTITAQISAATIGYPTYLDEAGGGSYAQNFTRNVLGVIKDDTPMSVSEFLLSSNNLYVRNGTKIVIKVKENA